jgi:hypothetical protein
MSFRIPKIHKKLTPLSEEQLKILDARFGSENVILIEKHGVFICDKQTKHSRAKTVELRDCRKVDGTCFTSTGEYAGTYVGKQQYFIMKDMLDDSELFLQYYYDREIIKEGYEHEL